MDVAKIKAAMSIIQSELAKIEVQASKPKKEKKNRDLRFSKYQIMFHKKLAQ